MITSFRRRIIRRAGGLYVFLLSQDLDDPGDTLNAQAALCDFLDRRSIKYVRTTVHEDFYDLLLEAAPRWLHPDHRYVMDQIMPSAAGREGAALRDWLSAQFQQRFRCAGSPPQWIQSAQWPINENGPLVFLGQVEIPNYFHDSAAAYVFLDPVVGNCETIIQVS